MKLGDKVYTIENNRIEELILVYIQKTEALYPFSDIGLACNDYNCKLCYENNLNDSRKTAVKLIPKFIVRQMKNVYDTKEELIDSLK